MVTLKQIQVFTALSALLFASACAKSIDPSQIPEQQEGFQENLGKGKVYVSALPISGATSRLGKVIGVVDAPVDDVWKVVVDYPSYKDYMPLVWESDIVRSESNKADIRLQYEVKPLPVKYWTVLRMTHNPRLYHIDWTQLEGDVKETYGSWDLAPYPGPGGKRTKVTYQLYFEIGNAVLDTGADWLTETVLPSVIDRLRSRIKDRDPALLPLPDYAKIQVREDPEMYNKAMEGVELR